MQNDRKLIIATAGSRRAINWQNQTLYWSELVDRLRTPVRGTETLNEYLKLPKSQQDELKDVGGFTGKLVGKRRKASSIVGRDLITLDLDNVPAGGTDEILKRLDSLECAYAVYSTRKHEENRPRLRVVVPLSRTATADEYEPLARKLASIIGISFMDPTTFEISRLFYWPSCCSDSTYVFQYGDKPFLDTDGLLATYGDWRNIKEWPEVPGAAQVHIKLAAKQGNPLEKNGIIGAFCKQYSIHSAIQTFLPGLYTSVDTGEERYTYIGGSTVGGAIVYDDGLFLFSHHATDPCSGKLVNAFDLVRLHKFGDLDNETLPGTPVTKLPSFKEMTLLAENDQLVQVELKQERLLALKADFEGTDTDPKRLFFDGKRFISAFMGEWFLQRHHCFVLNSDLYVYQQGVYVKGERLFYETATAALGVEFTPKRLSDSLSFIKNSVLELSPHAAVDTNGLLNLKNGLLDLDTLELHPHSPDVKTVVQLPVNYDPNADCSTIDRFLKMVVPADAIPVIEEMAGYCLIPSMKYEKALVLYGEGGNGKGTLIALLENLLGSKNVAGVSFQDLAENRFASAELFGKMANLHADIPSRVLENSSRFKELVSGDTIRAEEKHKSPFSFRNRAKLIFSANEPPTSKDNTEGFHRRLLMVPFLTKFNDRELRTKLFTSEALSGFLLRALEGLKRLQTQDGFSRSESVEQTLGEYRKRSDSVMRFLDECCVFENDAMEGKQTLYDSYRIFAVQWGNKPVSQANFNARMLAIHSEVSEYRKTAPRRWRGVRLTASSDFT